MKLGLIVGHNKGDLPVSVNSSCLVPMAEKLYVLGVSHGDDMAIVQRFWLLHVDAKSAVHRLVANSFYGALASAAGAAAIAVRQQNLYMWRHQGANTPNEYTETAEVYDYC